MREAGDPDVLKHQLNSAVLSTREHHCPRNLRFQYHFMFTYTQAAVRTNGHSFSTPLLGIPMLFCGPDSLLIVRICPGRNSSSPFASLDQPLVWLSLHLSECDAAVLCGLGFSPPDCASCNFEAMFLVGISGVGDASVHVEQNICPLG